MKWRQWVDCVASLGGVEFFFFNRLSNWMIVQFVEPPAAPAAFNILLSHLRERRRAIWSIKHFLLSSFETPNGQIVQVEKRRCDSNSGFRNGWVLSRFRHVGRKCTSAHALSCISSHCCICRHHSSSFVIGIWSLMIRHWPAESPSNQWNGIDQPTRQGHPPKDRPDAVPLIPPTKGSALLHPSFPL